MTMIVERVETRWRFAIVGKDRDAYADVFVVNSIDGDPKIVKIGIGSEQRIVTVVSLIDLLKKVAETYGLAP
jgi:hypothetical protein